MFAWKDGVLPFTCASGRFCNGTLGTCRNYWTAQVFQVFRVAADTYKSSFFRKFDLRRAVIWKVTARIF